MQIGTILIIMILTYYLKYIVDIAIFKDKRNKVIKTNNKINKLRKISIKSLEEQKTYLNLRYPKRTKFTMKKLDKFLISLFFYIIIYYIIYLCFKFLHVDISLGWGIAFLFVGPIIINYIFNIFNISKDDTLNYIMKGWFKNKGEKQ